MVSPYEIDSPFCNAKTVISVRESKSLEDREIGRQLAPLMEGFWPNRSQFSSVMVVVKGAFIVPAVDARSQVLSIKDRINCVGKLVFKLAPSGSGQLFTLVALDLCVPGVLGEVLQKVISEASTANV